jgi:hypothetical protein
MTTIAIVDENGAIVNRVEVDADSEWSPPEGCTTVDGSTFNIGGTYINGVYTPPPQPAAPPAPIPTISDRQFFQQLAIEGIISQDEALASNAAVIPAPLLNIINAMPADQQFAAKMIVSGATTFERGNPMTIAIGTAYGMTSDQIDAFFRAAASL